MGDIDVAERKRLVAMARKASARATSVLSGVGNFVDAIAERLAEVVGGDVRVVIEHVTD